MAQIFPIDFEEKLTMAQDDYILFSDSEDGNKIKKAQYKNLKGEKGDTGATGSTGPAGARINSASFSGDDIVFGETDGNTVTLAGAKTTLTGPQGDPGTPGADGNDGAAATITVGSVTTGAAGSSATVVNSGTSSAAVLDFSIPQGIAGTPGQDGEDGAAATITVGTTTTLPAGSSATVTNSGTSSAAVLNFGIPKGDAGVQDAKVFTLSSTSDLTNAQAAYDWYASGKEAIILYSGRYYYFKSTGGGGSVYFAVNEYTTLDNTDVTSLVQKTLTLALSGTTVTSISSWNMSLTNYNVLRTGKDYGTPYTPQYNGSPATKKYVDDSISGAIYSGSSAPSTPTEGMVWYDTTNDVLKIYDGTEWKTIAIGSPIEDLSAGTGIDITNNTISVTDPVLKNGSYGITGALSVKGSAGVQGTSIGDTSLATSGSTAIGFYARSDANHTVVIGHGATISSSGKRGIAIGAGATVTSAGSIQLGRGENTEAGSFNVALTTTPETSSSYVNYKLLDVNGKIPDARLNGGLVYSGTTAPSNPSEGMLWYDTANDVLKTYDGSNWNAVGSGSGDVVGPASSTDGHLAVFDGATGKLIKDGGAIPTGVPSGGTDGQFLGKVSGNLAWATPSGLPAGGTNGQIIMMVNGTPTWVTPTQKGFIMDAGGPTTIKYIWAGDETSYGNLGTYDNNTHYDTY